MITTLLLLLSALLAVFLLIATLRPDDFHVVRSTAVSAPPAVAFAYVNDLRKWQEMSPYVKLDPAAKYVFAGPPAGTGASLAWAGNSKAGEGRITITESRPNELVRMRLDMFKPFTCTNTVEFTFRPTGDQITTTWGMFGKCNLMGKVMGLIMNMDKMCGDQFEEGLANLKSLAEAAARK